MDIPRSTRQVPPMIQKSEPNRSKFYKRRYKTYREQGLFYGSGVIEGGCKSVIGQRLKESGMFWTEPGATSVLTLRLAQKSYRWDECWDRLHDSHYLNFRAAA